MNNRFEIRKDCFVLFLFLAISAIVLFFCSKNSPFYVFNDWVDANAFFTMGKGMMNGLVPYKDLFEQKGPILYFIYGIGYLLDNDGFTGIYILEVLSSTILCYCLYKLSKLMICPLYSFFATLLTFVVISSSTSFVQGGSAEEFVLPLIAFSLYSFFLLIQEENNKYIFLNGLVAGIVTLIKFNLLGFWFAWMAVYFFYLVSKRKYKYSIQACLVFLSGMIIPILIFAIYFMINGALLDFINSYFLFNVTAYTTEISLAERITNTFSAFFMQLNYNLDVKVSTIISFLSLFYFVYCKRTWEVIFLVFSFLLLIFGIYFGGLPFIYYYLCFTPYIIFGCIVLFKMYSSLKEGFFSKITVDYLVFLVVACFMVYNMQDSPNLEYSNVKKSDLAQFEFKEIIDQEEDKTLLNYDNLDGGFYTSCNIVPNVKYFMRQNVDYERYPEIIDSQNQYITEGKTNFVIIREYFGNFGYRNQLDDLNKNYELVDVVEQEYEHMDFVYYLYQRKS